MFLSWESECLTGTRCNDLIFCLESFWYLLWKTQKIAINITRHSTIFKSTPMVPYFEHCIFKSSFGSCLCENIIVWISWELGLTHIGQSKARHKDHEYCYGTNCHENRKTRCIINLLEIHIWLIIFSKSVHWELSVYGAWLIQRT